MATGASKKASTNSKSRHKTKATDRRAPSPPRQETRRSNRIAHRSPSISPIPSPERLTRVGRGRRQIRPQQRPSTSGRKRERNTRIPVIQDSPGNAPRSGGRNQTVEAKRQPDDGNDLPDYEEYAGEDQPAQDVLTSKIFSKLMFDSTLTLALSIDREDQGEPTIPETPNNRRGLSTELGSPPTRRKRSQTSQDVVRDRLQTARMNPSMSPELGTAMRPSSILRRRGTTDFHSMSSSEARSGTIGESEIPTVSYPSSDEQPRSPRRHCKKVG
ncbi:hypothetical protein K431DRAFT_295801 [Polychaeton citri CBS 116435]|uniref:Uncharacterized protein n=1 Tax=Polychaeton citri CBS 116435 TaxID=1314669 RepID=A0A9P4Q795_9PEZI|nr:hypothetical protein K431DRAFT_295801 [Polychaeton citri CBS 116435]